jgi:hypothetical protein
LERIESMAGIKLERVSFPSEEDMQKAKSKCILKNFKILIMRFFKILEKMLKYF